MAMYNTHKPNVYFQWGLLQNDPYTVNEENGRVF